LKDFTHHKPLIKVTDDEVFFEFVIEIHIRNPFNVSWDVAEIHAKVVS
jgi:hypothetical protein